jgi:hypothetical protein
MMAATISLEVSERLPNYACRIRVLLMVYDIQNYWVLSIVKKSKYDTIQVSTF